MEMYLLISTAQQYAYTKRIKSKGYAWNLGSVHVGENCFNSEILGGDTIHYITQPQICRV
jgi:hypothetical protein